MPNHINVLLFLLLVTKHIHGHYHTAYFHETIDFASFPVRNQWMTGLDGNRRLNTLSIPGTHDSAARHGFLLSDVYGDWSTFIQVSGGVYIILFLQLFNVVSDGEVEALISNMVKTQSLSISDQLKYGIRFFDIRIRLVNNDFALYHGAFDQKLIFNAGVLTPIKQFLQVNPGEAILMRIKQEGDPKSSTMTFEQGMDNYVAYFADVFWPRPTGPDSWAINNPRLSEIRGRVVILQDFSASKQYGISYGNFFYTQDNYALSGMWDLYTKWTAVKGRLQEAVNSYRNGDCKPTQNAPYINFLSAAQDAGNINWASVSLFIDLVNPYFVASGHENPGTSAPRQWTWLLNPGNSDTYPDFPRDQECTQWIWGDCIEFEGTNVLCANYMQQNEVPYIGIVPVDFPGPGLIDAIINANTRWCYQGCNSCTYQGGCEAQFTNPNTYCSIAGARSPQYQGDNYQVPVCNTGWTQYATRCYKLFTSAVTQAQARDACTAQAARLVAVHSPGEMQFLVQLIASTTGEFATWLDMNLAWNGMPGGSITSISCTDSAWVDYGNPKVAGVQQQGVYPWNSGEPNNQGGGYAEACVHFTSSANGAKWNDIPCHFTMYYICKK